MFILPFFMNPLIYKQVKFKAFVFVITNLSQIRYGFYGIKLYDLATARYLTVIPTFFNQYSEIKFDNSTIMQLGNFL